MRCRLVLFWHAERRRELHIGSLDAQSTEQLKKKLTPKPLSRRCQRVGNDSQSGRLQLLFHQTTSISTLRLDGPAHAWLPTDHVIGQGLCRASSRTVGSSLVAM